VQPLNLANRVAEWADHAGVVRASVLIGSRVREQTDGIWKADSQSDWDFQIIASRSDLFQTSDWIRNLGVDVRTYVVRRAALGGVPKVAAVLAETEADFVILPAGLLRVSRLLVRFGVHRKSRYLRNKMQDLAVVIRPGWKFLTGGSSWEPFYRRIVAEIPDFRLKDSDIRELNAGFACDVVWTLRKIDRGEWIAAQRMLHRSLQETNLRLMHELRLRKHQRTFPEGRRAELILDREDLDGLNVTATLDASSLRNAVKKATATCCRLTIALVGDTPVWPADLRL
jgi:hypothetical protein